MSAGDDHGARAHFEQFLPRGFHSGYILHFHAGQEFRFRHVRRDHARALQKFIAYEFQPRRIEQFGVARRRARNRIEHHVREFVLVEKFRHHRGVRAVRQHSDFHGRDGRIFRQRVELRAQRGRRSRMHGAHALRGLHRQRGNRGHAVAIVRRKCFQIGGNARAAGRIESGNRQKYWWRVARDCVDCVMLNFCVPSARGTNAGDTRLRERAGK